MINYDMHIHTHYCGHAPAMTVRAICEKTHLLGLATIAITDHVFGRDSLEVIEKIKQELRQINPALNVIVGAEVDVDGLYKNGRLVTDSLDGIDYIVAGFHYVPGVGNYPLCPEDCRINGDEFMMRWEKALLGIVSNPKIHTLAHPARLLASATQLDLYFYRALAVFEKAAKISALNNIAWEINELTGKRLNAYWAGQWHQIYEAALSEGVKLIYGSDAHTPADIGSSEFTQSILARLPAGSLADPAQILKK